MYVMGCWVFSQRERVPIMPGAWPWVVKVNSRKTLGGGGTPKIIIFGINRHVPLNRACFVPLNQVQGIKIALSLSKRGKFYLSLNDSATRLIFPFCLISHVAWFVYSWFSRTVQSQTQLCSSSSVTPSLNVYLQILLSQLPLWFMNLYNYMVKLDVSRVSTGRECTYSSFYKWNGHPA